MLRSVHGKCGKGLAVALAVSGLLLFAGCGKKDQQKAQTAVAVKTMQVIKRDTPNVHEFMAHGTKPILGSEMIVNVDTKALAQQLVDDLNEKRQLLGWK